MGVRSWFQRAAAPGVPTQDDVEFRYSFADWIKDAVTYTFNGNAYTVPVTVPPSQGEAIENSYEHYAAKIYKQNAPAFAVIQTRIALFSEVEFCYQNTTTRKTYTTAGLARLQEPWPNGTTGELLARMEQDVSLAGNSYWKIDRDRLRHLQPHKVLIVLKSTQGDPEKINDLNSIVGGYLYCPDGITHPESGIPLLLNEVIHWSPIPDPAASYRGMSWLTPVVREIMADSAASEQKTKFFENGMTSNMVIRFPEGVKTQEQFLALRDAMEQSHGGVENAYKTLYLAAGADATVIGANPEQAGLKAIQAAGETRIAAAGRVPPVVAGLSEGLGAATYSNYGQARRQFADGWARPQWRSVCAALEKIAAPQSDSRLWYDPDGIAFLREDAKNAADTTTAHATAVVTLVNGGFTADSTVLAVQSGDLSLLEHTNLVSVQLQAPGSVQNAPNPPDSGPNPPPTGEKPAAPGAKPPLP